MFNRICRHQLDSGQRQRAIQTATQWLNTSPLSEAAYRTLLEGYVLTGARTAALKAYEACRQMLKTEFGVAPSPATEKLAAQIDKMSGHLQTVTRAEKQETTLVSLPFIGRTVEH